MAAASLSEPARELGNITRICSFVECETRCADDELDSTRALLDDAHGKQRPARSFR
jgi:hypothetical protein